MLEFVTITSKRQLTLPSKLAKKLSLKAGQKMAVTEDDGRLILTPAEANVEKLAGTLTIPTNWQGKNMDRIIEDSKKEYFKK